MIHYVLLKFEANYYNDDILNYTKSVFDNIGKIANIYDVRVHANCMDRNTNMDIMIEMRVNNKDDLTFYLQHDLHRAFVNTVDSHVVLRVTFDCE